MLFRSGRLTAAEIDAALNPTDLSGGIFDTGEMPRMTPELIAEMEGELDAADRREN